MALAVCRKGAPAGVTLAAAVAHEALQAGALPPAHIYRHRQLVKYRLSIREEWSFAPFSKSAGQRPLAGPELCSSHRGTADDFPPRPDRLSSAAVGRRTWHA